jgi:glycosyltransferase involved in cell wall biosynthesis
MKNLAYVSASSQPIIWFLKREIIELSKFSKIYIFTEKNKDIEILCRNKNIFFIELNFSRRVSFIKDFISIIRLIKFIKQKNITFIKTITLKGGFVGMIAAAFCRINKRYHVNAGIAWMRKNLFIKILSYIFEIPTMLISTHIQTDSFEQREILHRLYGVKKKIIIFNQGSLCGVPDYKINSRFKDSNRKRMRKFLSIDDNQKVLIFVGRICKDKGINELVDAFIELNKDSKNNPYILILLGLIEKEHDTISKKTSEIINNSKHIIHINNRKNVFPYMHMSDLLIIPSYGEGFCNVVIEANASGIPVLGTRVNGLNESIVEKYNGIKVKSHSSKSIRDGVRFILSDFDLYNKLKINGLENVRKNFSGNLIHELNMKKILELLR